MAKPKPVPRAIRAAEEGICRAEEENEAALVLARELKHLPEGEARDEKSVRTVFQVANSAKALGRAQALTEVARDTPEEILRTDLVLDPDGPGGSRMIAARIKTLMQSRDLNQVQAASLVGRPRSTFHAWIAGGTDQSAEGIAQISHAFGVSADYLLGLVADERGRHVRVDKIVERRVPDPPVAWSPFARIPLAREVVSGGFPALVTPEDPGDGKKRPMSHAFRKAFLRTLAEVAKTPSELSEVSATGSSGRRGVLAQQRHAAGRQHMRQLVDFDELAVLLGRLWPKSGSDTGARQEERKARAKNVRIYVYRQVRSGNLPAPFKVSPGRIAWDRAELEGWLASRPRVRYGAKASTEAA